MAWTTPKTWSADELVGAANLNTHIRDNMNELKDPPFYHSAITANWSASATDYTGVSSLSAVLGTNGGDVLVGFQAATNTYRSCVNLLIDGSAYTSANSGLDWRPEFGTTASKMHYTVWVTGLASGTHTFQPILRTINAANYAPLLGGQSPTIFWAREVS